MSVLDYVLECKYLSSTPMVSIESMNLDCKAINALVTLFPHVVLPEGVNIIFYFMNEEHLDAYIDLLRLIE